MGPFRLARDRWLSEREVGVARAVRRTVALLAVVLLLLGLGSTGFGVLGTYAQSHNSFQYCEDRLIDAPVDVVPFGESASSGESRSSWPLGVTCHYLKADGGTYLLQPGWTLTWQVWGGLALVALALFLLCGVAIAAAISTIRSTRIRP